MVDIAASVLARLKNKATESDTSLMTKIKNTKTTFFIDFGVSDMIVPK